ncbi:hypothetical protein D3C81_1319190 [compost metagenome]
MDVISVILNGFASFVNDSSLCGKACSCDGITLGDINIYTVDAEVGIELGVPVILMEVPALSSSTACAYRFIDADLWKPLSCHYEITVFAHASKYFG